MMEEGGVMVVEEGGVMVEDIVLPTSDFSHIN